MAAELIMPLKMPPRILPCGDCALSVEFGDVIDIALNQRVLALDAAVTEAGHPAILELVPSYRSLMVHYEPIQASFAQMSQWLLQLEAGLTQTSIQGRHWRVPVVYGGEFGEDLEAVAKARGLTPDALVARHVGADYRVYMLGFTPGFAYLGGLDPMLATPRRDEPRLVTPSGSVSVGGIQAALQCLVGPSGWHLLGRSPVRTYHPGRNPMFMMAPGDRVSFYAIAPDEWSSLDEAAEAGQMIAEQLA